MLMSRHDSPRLATIWTCLKTAPLSAPSAGCTPWTQTQGRAATSGGYHAIACSLNHAVTHSLRAHFTIFLFPFLFLLVPYFCISGTPSIPSQTPRLCSASPLTQALSAQWWSWTESRSSGIILLSSPHREVCQPHHQPPRVLGHYEQQHFHSSHI